MNSKSNKTWIASMLLGLTASLCCFTPIVTLVSGFSGIAAAVSWVEPARPFLIAIAIFLLGIAWYQQLRAGKRPDVLCLCDEDKQSPFFKSKTFLGLITITTVLSIAFPYYGEVFGKEKVEFPDQHVEGPGFSKVEFKIQGMTCSACTHHVENEVSHLPGIVKSEASFEAGNAIVEFEATKTSIKEIEQAINSTGYVVMETKTKK